MKIAISKEEDLKLFKEVIEKYLKFLKYSDKSSVNLVYKGCLIFFLEDLKKQIKLCITKPIQELPDHVAIVFVNAILFYLGSPDRDRKTDKQLSNIATIIIKEIYNEK
jgi:hypothetical protein